MPDKRNSEDTASTEAKKTETEDVEPHGIEVEDDTEAAVLDINVSCA